MKAKELMIGDWMQFADGNKKCTVVGIKCDARYLEEEAIITVMDRSGHWFNKEMDYLKPIPLTAEFFEKNGFEIDVDIVGAFWVSKDKRIIVRKGFSNMAGRDWAIHIDNKDMQTIASGCIQFVHQFQNKLNDAEIEMEVIL
jgi:hypothetical protein